MRILFLFVILILTTPVLSQERSVEVLTFEEYMAFVKKYHPVARQANLYLDRGEAELLRARGGFDPKIEVDYARKKFKGTEYYDVLNSTFKIPTWYGIELKAGFEQNEGLFLNPEKTVPQDGLFSTGISLALGQGLFINERMAALRSARAFREQTVAEKDLLINELLYQAAIAYFDWLRIHNELEIYTGFMENAKTRFNGIRRSAMAGEVAAIDTVEAKISLQDRALQLEQAKVKLMKQRLVVSNYLWLENNVPVELLPDIVPDKTLFSEVDESFELTTEGFEGSIEDHPKLRAMRSQLSSLEINRRLKANQLLPEVNFEYNFLTQEPDLPGSYQTPNYKTGLSVRIPLFLRKERGELKLAEFKVEEQNLKLSANQREIENKIEGLRQELKSYQAQIGLIQSMVDNYNRMLAAEERKFSFGESSLFLINTRESKLIEIQLKENELLTKFLYTKANLFQSQGSNPIQDR